MDAQLKKGLTDICVLAALKDGESYGYKIVTALLPYFEISESTLYPVLRRLENKNEVTSRTEEHAGRLRRYYSLTQRGLDRLEEFSNTAKILQTITEFIQSGGKK